MDSTSALSGSASKQPSTVTPPLTSVLMPMLFRLLVTAPPLELYPMTGPDEELHKTLLVGAPLTPLKSINWVDYNPKRLKSRIVSQQTWSLVNKFVEGWL